jgi:hypothetical protein
MPSTTIKYFAFAHLPAHLQAVSKPVGLLAEQFEQQLPDGPEKSAGMRKLLEAKDCFVRAALDVPKPPAPGSDRPPHQQRVVAERLDLAEKLTKLHEFINTPTYTALPDDEQGRLVLQLDAMRGYCDILNQRIKAFPVVDHQAI